MTGWTRILEASAESGAAYEAALADPERAQSDLLLRIIRANQDCEFGRSHGFAGLSTVKDYRNATPIRSYAGFESHIIRMAAGEPGVLTTSPVIAFEETGGTSSGAKLIPYTQDCLTAFRAAALPWLADLARRRPGVRAGKTYVSMSPATRQPKLTVGGMPVGLPSEAAYLGDDLVSPFLAILAVPPFVATIGPVDAWRLATLTALLESHDLSFVSVWSPTFFLALLEAIAANEAALAAALGAPARARLKAFLHSGGDDTSVLWPQLDTISCWRDGSSAAFASRLALLCPQAQIEPKGLFATESAITLPWGGEAGCLPALTSAFIEFIDGNGVSHLAHDLTAGDGYRVVITTPGGLYRYDIGDQVRCIGHEGEVARLVFEGRAGLTSDMVGEKLDEAFVTEALAGLPCAAALSPRPLTKPHYELWLDAGAVDPSFAVMVETALCQNPQYAYARKIGQLGPLATLSRPGFVSARHNHRAKSGARLGDMKHSSLILE